MSAPTLGALKNLRPTHLSGLYGALLRDAANLAARTVGLVQRALGHATGWDSAEYRGTSGPSSRCASRNSNSDSGPGQRGAGDRARPCDLPDRDAGAGGRYAPRRRT